jgi:nucleoside-diphosphate-sugar epimerase
MPVQRVLVTGGSGFIGVHLVGYLLNQGYDVLNIDIQRPVDGSNLTNWESISILESELFESRVLSFNPNLIIHLAATTDQNSRSLSDFKVNIDGTRNLIKIAEKLVTLDKIVIVSTQYVNKPGKEISDDLNSLDPYGFYGESKLISEKLITASGLFSKSIILRPTNIWGPWHRILTNGLWKEIDKGRYLHIQSDRAIKSYGYVGNAVWQIERLLRLENAVTASKTFYLQDANMPQEEWVSAFEKRLSGRNLRRIPKWMMWSLAVVGSCITSTGLNCPIYLSRYRNMITSNPIPVNLSLSFLGSVPFSTAEGVNVTCEWFLNNKDTVILRK